MFLAEFEDHAAQGEKACVDIFAFTFARIRLFRIDSFGSSEVDEIDL